MGRARSGRVPSAGRAEPTSSPGSGQVQQFLSARAADYGHHGKEPVVTDLNLEQLRKQAKERVRARRAAGEQTTLAAAQLELARERGFASWPRLKEYVERLGAEQPFHTDIAYYEGRADGIATVNGLTVAEARRDL